MKYFSIIYHAMMRLRERGLRPKKRIVLTRARDRISSILDRFTKNREIANIAPTTGHSQKRSRRGRVSDEDAELIADWGTASEDRPTASEDRPTVYRMTDEAADAAIEKYPHEKDRIDRLRGCEVPVSDDGNLAMGRDGAEPKLRRQRRPQRKGSAELVADMGTEVPPRERPESEHAKKRKCQRGFRKDDVRLIWFWGTEIREGVFRMTDKDADEAMANVKDPKLQHQIDRVRGREVVVADDCLVTAYFAKYSHRRNPRDDNRRPRR